jgi:transcriptional regulator with XRE-family HTH domain
MTLRDVRQLSTYGLRLVPEKLTKARTAQGFSQRQLAEKVGVTRFMINRLEAGTRLPSPDTVKAIAEALGTTVGRLTERVKPEPPVEDVAEAS